MNGHYDTDSRHGTVSDVLMNGLSSSSWPGRREEKMATFLLFGTEWHADPGRVQPL